MTMPYIADALETRGIARAERGDCQGGLIDENAAIDMTASYARARPCSACGTRCSSAPPLSSCTARVISTGLSPFSAAPRNSSQPELDGLLRPRAGLLGEGRLQIGVRGGRQGADACHTTTPRAVLAFAVRAAIFERQGRLDEAMLGSRRGHARQSRTLVQLCRPRQPLAAAGRSRPRACRSEHRRSPQSGERVRSWRGVARCCAIGAIFAGAMADLQQGARRASPYSVAGPDRPWPDLRTAGRSRAGARRTSKPPFALAARQHHSVLRRGAARRRVRVLRRSMQAMRSR